MSSEDLEDLVLADLLSHLDGARDVVSWLPVTAFTPGPRQQLYELAASMIAENYPVDPLIVAWEADRLGAASGGRSLDSAFVFRIGALETPPGTAAELGRWLLADWWCGTTLGEDWHTKPLPVPAEAQAKHDTPAAPLQPATGQPVPDGQRRPESEPRAVPAVSPMDERTAAQPAQSGRPPAPTRPRPMIAPPDPAFREPAPQP
jgi:hypothetical protein